MGKLSSCSDIWVFQQDKCNGTMADSGLPRIWTNAAINFGLSLTLQILFYSQSDDPSCSRLDRAIFLLVISGRND